ncbi:MAG TPA: hypothetical protein VJT16_22035 [Streptosporangiaceae bacterium]|nr:hypothetical protein [Streptosporangiaceae bacterium]
MTIAARVRPALVVAAVEAVVIAWAAVPADGARAGLKPVLIVAIACAFFTAAMLLSAPGVARIDRSYARPDAGFLSRTWSSILKLPWPQGLVVASLGLEALHQSRPWHSAVLGVLMLGFLLAVHLAEASARPAVFRPHLRLLAVGVALAALSAGAAMVPALGATSGSGLLAVIAAIAAVIAAALALPL